MSAISSNRFSTDDQTADVISYLSHQLEHHAVMEKFVKDFPEYNGLTWEGSWVNTQDSDVEPDYMSWVRDWIEDNTPVYWEDGEPWIDDAVQSLNEG
jgi:hypothetical protein